MKLDEKILEEKIREYRKTKSCSESTLMALCETAEASISKEEMLRLACGYSGGIGATFDEGTCGALNGALIADGILLEDQDKIKANAKILFNSFKDEYGSVCCGVMTNNGEDKSVCVDCCVFIAQKLAKLLDE